MIIFVLRQNTNQEAAVFVAFCIFLTQVFLKSRITETDHWFGSQKFPTIQTPFTEIPKYSCVRIPEIPNNS